MNREEQMNWNSGAPTMTPSAVPEMPLGPALTPVAEQPGSMSGVEAIREFTNNLWGNK